MIRIARICIENVRAIESVELDLSRSLTVLIGENGAGKSTVIECLELLRKAAEPTFMQQLYSLHRGLNGLLRKGATELTLGLVVEGRDDEPRIVYAFTLGLQGAGAVVLRERLTSEAPGQAPVTIIQRGAATGELLDPNKGKPRPLPPELLKGDQLVVASFGSVPPLPAIQRLLGALRGIEVHLAFDTLAGWAARSYQRPVVIRGVTTHFPATRLELLGMNLANAWSELQGRDDAHRQETLELVKRGLGERVEGVFVRADPGGGNIYLAVRFVDLREPVPASDLSDGQLAWLAFVAMIRLDPGRSFLAIDEPELHLHPQLLGGVVELLKVARVPVLISTHADRILSLLQDPVDAVRVCSLDEQGRVAIARLDAQELPRWTSRFGDLSGVRANGYLPRVLESKDRPGAAGGHGR